MTFDFAPNWMTSRLTDLPFSPSELGRPPLQAPGYPSNAETAALVHELFSEGTLSPEQLCSLAGLPELHPHLQNALAAIPAPRTR